MTDTQGEVKILDDALVADYLRRHPNFFLAQDDLLADLKIPHARGTSVSLVERQMAVLRQRGLDMRSRLTQLLEVARDNDRLFQLTRDLTLQLLEADSLEALVAALEDSLKQKFKVEFVGLVFFAQEPLAVGRTENLADAQKKISGLLVGIPVCGALRESELQFLFGEQQAQSIQSAAVISIAHKEKLGVLALGSENPQQYSNAVDTLFLDYIAQVVARLLPTLLASTKN